MDIGAYRDSVCFWVGDTESAAASIFESVDTDIDIVRAYIVFPGKAFDENRACSDLYWNWVSGRTDGIDFIPGA